MRATTILTAAVMLLGSACGSSAADVDLGPTTSTARNVDPAEPTTTVVLPPDPSASSAGSAPAASTTMSTSTTTAASVTTSSTSSTTSTTMAPPIDGAMVFTLNCASCHGTAAEGGFGPTLAYPRVPGTFPSRIEELAVVRDGRGDMPAFGGVLSPAELDAVVDWIRSRA